MLTFKNGIRPYFQNFSTAATVPGMLFTLVSTSTLRVQWRRIHLD